MPKTRIYIEDLKGKPDYFVLSGENAKIVKNVMRVKKGEEIELVDGEGALYAAELDGYSKDGARISISRRETFQKPYMVGMTLLQAFPKGKRIDFVIQKMVELAVDRMIFFKAERSVPSYRGEKVARLEKIAVEALRQCKRLYKPDIVLTDSLDGALAAARDCGLKLLFHEDESGSIPLNKVLKEATDPTEVAFAVGPEGSFSFAELKKFQKDGFKQVVLGKEVLRTETAPLAALAILNARYRW